MNKIISVVSFAISFAIFFLSMMTEAHAQQLPRTFYINPIQLSGLSPYKGRVLTVYYALGSRGALNNQEDQITIREVKEKRTFVINGDQLNIPELSLRRSNVLVAYNILVLVIHDENPFMWVNGNRTLPEGQMNTGNTQFIAVDSLTKVEFDQLRDVQGIPPGQPIRYQFGMGVPVDNF